MKIHFDNVNLSSRSGPNTFAARLAAELTSMGHKVVSTYNQSDISCVFIQENYLIPESHPKVQRLDGIWFKPEEFHNLNLPIKRSYETCNRVIWQSQFDKSMTSHHWGLRPGSVINNGAILKKVEIENESILSLRQKYEMLFVCSANWHRQKRLKENTELFLKVKDLTGLKCCLVVMGNGPDAVVNHPDIYYTGSVPHDICLQIFSAADWMIHLAWLDHCPNTVVEALSQKCPVICTDSGGTKEIVGKNGLILAETTQYNFELTDYDSPYRLEFKDIESFDWLKKTEVKNEHLNIKSVAERYLKVFTSVLEGK